MVGHFHLHCLPCLLCLATLFGQLYELLQRLFVCGLHGSICNLGIGQMDAQIVGEVAVGLVVGHESAITQSERIEVALCALLGGRRVGLQGVQT